MKTVFRLTILSLILLAGEQCKKNTQQNPGTGGDCLVTSCPSYFGTTQTFTYDSKRQMTGRKYDFGYAGYGPFTQTVDADKIYSVYTHSGDKLEETDLFQGGTGNLYDGQPEAMIRHEHQTHADGSLIFDSGNVTDYTFGYDSKKRLTSVIYHHLIQTSSPALTYSRQLYTTNLYITYDDNDNAVLLRQNETFRYGTYVVQDPSQSQFYYDSIPNTTIRATYDAKPSPFSGSLKYWKFVQNDWGLAINTNWPAIITALSAHNPLTMQWELSQGNSSSQKYTMQYNYNDKGYPADSYTYQCN